MNYVYVLDPDGKPMMPTTRFGKVRRMLRSGEAKAVTTRPFTIRLTYWPKTHETQPVVAGFDPGRTNIGLCMFFVKHFSLKKASEFPVFNEGFSLL